MEQKILERLKNLDESAYELLYDDYFWQATSGLDKRVDMPMRKDIFNDVLLSLIDRINGDSNFEINNLAAWLRGACIKKAQTRLRKNMNLVPLQFDQGEELNDDTSDGYDKLKSARLKKALEQLGDGCRELIIMFYYKEFDYDELSSILGLSRDYIKNKKARCMKKIKSLI